MLIKENIGCLKIECRLSICLAVIGLVVSAYARTIVMPPQPVSTYADAEVSTNIAFNTHRSDLKELEFRFAFGCAASNAVQVAFGRDADGDGILSLRETGAVYGWRNGRCFAEDLASGIRHEDVMCGNGTDTGRVFTVRMRTTGNRTPKDFSASGGSVPVLTDLAVSVPVWLYRAEWNLMRITRRGVGAPAEWFECDIGYPLFYITIR